MGGESKSNLLAFITEILAFTILPEFFSINFSKRIKNKRVKESVYINIYVYVDIYIYVHTCIYM